MENTNDIWAKGGVLLGKPIKRIVKVKFFQSVLIIALLALQCTGQGRALASEGRIAFGGALNGNSGLYVSDLDGSNIVKVGTWGFNNPSWFPDGRRLVAHFARGEALEISNGIYILNLDGTPPTLIEGRGYKPRLSSDGTKIVYEFTISTPTQIRTMNSDGTNSVRVLPGGYEPSWSPDGTKIVFVRYRNSQANLWVMNEDGSDQIQLTNDSIRELDPVWSPKGDKIAYWARHDGGISVIYTVDLSGGEPTNLTANILQVAAQPSWSPDGRQIIFVGSEGIAVMDEGGGSPMTVLKSDSRLLVESAPAWWGGGLTTLVQSLSWGQLKTTYQSTAHLNP